MKHFIKVPKTEAAIEAAQAILTAKGVVHCKTAREIAKKPEYGPVIYLWTEEGSKDGFFCELGSHSPGLADTLTDLTYLFKEMEVNDTITAVNTGPTLKVKINKAITSVGCQTFKNADILRIADLVRKVTQ